MGVPNYPEDCNLRNPFCMVYGSEAILPAEIAVETLRIHEYNPFLNKDRRVHELNLLESIREEALGRTREYQQKMARTYNRGVRPRILQVGDLVLRRADILKPLAKLDPKWEGPYKITKARANGSYELEDLEGRRLQRLWNIRNLRKYYC